MHAQNVHVNKTLTCLCYFWNIAFNTNSRKGTRMFGRVACFRSVETSACIVKLIHCPLLFAFALGVDTQVSPAVYLRQYGPIFKICLEKCECTKFTVVASTWWHCHRSFFSDRLFQAAAKSEAYMSNVVHYCIEITVWRSIPAGQKGGLDRSSFAAPY